MSENKKKLAIGFITYGKSTSKYLPYFLSSLKKQSFTDFEILAVDNSEERENENSGFIKENYPEIKLEWTGKNIGFGRAFNLMINKSMGNGAEFFLALNPDMLLEPDAVEEMIKKINENKKTGAVQAKILKWDFPDKETNIIDSYGILCDRYFRFRDNGQGERDRDNFLKGRDEIFGFTGAAVLLTKDCLLDVAFDNGHTKEYFDELMFMYKEDCDLSLRLRLQGWKISLSEKAVIYHDRTASRMGDSMWAIIQNRKGKKRNIKKWSFLNQWIIVLKFTGLPFSSTVKFSVYWYQFKILLFSILFEQYLLFEFLKLWKIGDKIKERKKQIRLRVSPKEIENLMS